MGKKKYTTPRKEAPSQMSMLDKLKGAAKDTDLSVPEKKAQKEDTNSYKNYDPGRDNRKNSDSRRGYGNYNNRKPFREGSSKGDKKSAVHKLPKDQGPHAPYNFVRMQDRVMEAKNIPGHDRIAGEELFTGYLHYELTAQTPIMVGGRQGEFFRNKDGRFALPGSTMRGLIRSNLQLLSFSGFRDDIDDYSLMYRAVAGGSLSERYSTVLGEKSELINGHQITILRNVRAGYIERKGKDYYIYRNVGDSDHTFKEGEADYYTVSERYVLEKASEKFAYLTDKFQNRGPFTEYKKGHYKGRENKNYSPYYEEITYELSNNHVCGIQKTGLRHKGYVMSTGRMNEKKVFYVIPERNPNERIPIPEDSVAAFQADLRGRQNTIKKFLDFYSLPEDDRIRPVFYIELEGKLYFGYTPRLRLMFDHKIHEGIHQETVPCDYAKAIFGYSDKEKSLKSRVFFTDAELTSQKELKGQTELILAEPKPTSYLEYLEQTDGKKVKTYNEDQFSLRGVKQYWLHDKIKETGKEKGEKAVMNKAIYSSFRPLAGGSRFGGNIWFENLTEVELGLLIWSIRLEKDAQMNVGKAKAYGYGRVKVDEMTLYLLNTKKAYAADSAAFGVNLYDKKTEAERDAFVSVYKNMLAEWLWGSGHGGEEVMNHPTIRDFFKMKSCLMDERNTSYMTLDEFREFSKDRNPLPTVDDITAE